MKIAYFTHPSPQPERTVNGNIIPAESAFQIISPAYNDIVSRKGMTDDECLSWAIARVVPSGTPYYIVDDTDIPKDTSNRFNWREANGVIDTNFIPIRGG